MKSALGFCEWAFSRHLDINRWAFSWQNLNFACGTALGTLNIQPDNSPFEIFSKIQKKLNYLDILPLNDNDANTRLQVMFNVPFARKTRYMNSAIPKMARMLNARKKMRIEF